MIKNVRYLLTTHDNDLLPKDDTPEIVIIGRSNVGKSSFINSISSQKNLAYVGKTPGKTKVISLFDVSNGKYRLVDVPGYGYAKVTELQKKILDNVVDKYFNNRKNIFFVVLLLDSRRGVLPDDQKMIDFLISKKIRFTIIGTKLDKLNQSQKHKFKKDVIYKVNINPILFSSLTKKNLSEVEEMIESLII